MGAELAKASINVREMPMSDMQVQSLKAINEAKEPMNALGRGVSGANSRLTRNLRRAGPSSRLKSDIAACRFRANSGSASLDRRPVVTRCLSDGRPGLGALIHRAFYLPVCDCMAFSICSLTASRLKLAPFCIGGNSIAVWASLPTSCCTNWNRQNSKANQL